MPRLSALRSEALRDLAGQFRFASRKNALRALAVLDTLAERIDDDGAYSTRWLVHELTGYTPDESDADAMFPGDALRAELSALAEHIAAAVSVRADEVEGALTVDDLAQRWSASRRTIERYRRDGLVARRVGEGADARLLFTRDAVASFERLRPRAVARASGFSRTDDAEQANILRRARRYRARLNLALTPAAERIALRTGRSVATVRRIILAHDRAADTPIFAARRSIEDKRRDAVMRAVRRGVPPSALAKALARSRDSIARIANEQTLALLRAYDLRAPVSATFERPDAAEVLLAPAVVRADLLPGVTLDAGAFLDEARAVPAPDARDESALAVALSFLRNRASRALAALPAHAPSAATLDEIETDLRWASRLVIKLARTQRRIALAAVEERLGDPLDLRDEHVRALHLASMRALCDASLRFDPFRPGRANRLAARSAVALTQALSAAIASFDLAPDDGRAKARRRRDRAVTLADWTRHSAPWTRFVEPDPRVRRGLDSLDDDDRRLLTLRFGLDGAPPRTRAQVAGD
ncbi:MAG: hypothetical protein ACTS27_10620, partial [Phycisphaerales bacterium]